MTTKKVRLGLIGCGAMMREAHVPRLLRMPEVDIGGICDSDAGSLAQLCQRHPTLKRVPAFADYRELLAKAEMDGVVISTPHTLHFAQIRDALERGLHVLTEKPMVVRSDHARELIKLRDRVGRVLLIAYQRHYQPAYRYLRKCVQEERLGRINMIVGHQSENWLPTNRDRWRTNPAFSGGGVMADVMSHILEAILWITNLDPIEVYACFDPQGTPVEVVAALTVRFAGGVIASLSTGGNTRRACFHEEINIWGDTGALQLIWERGATVTEWMPEKRLVPDTEWPTGSDPDTNFINAILGREEVCVPAEWGLKVTLLKEAAWESGRTGRTTKVSSIRD